MRAYRLTVPGLFPNGEVSGINSLDWSFLESRTTSISAGRCFITRRQHPGGRRHALWVQMWCKKKCNLNVRLWRFGACMLTCLCRLNTHTHTHICKPIKRHKCVWIKTWKVSPEGRCAFTPLLQLKRRDIVKKHSQTLNYSDKSGRMRPVLSHMWGDTLKSAAQTSQCIRSLCSRLLSPHFFLYSAVFFLILRLVHKNVLSYLVWISSEVFKMFISLDFLRTLLSLI